MIYQIKSAVIQFCGPDLSNKVNNNRPFTEASAKLITLSAETAIVFQSARTIDQQKLEEPVE